MKRRTMPLYLAFVEGVLVRCIKNGGVNWGNTQWYALEDLEKISTVQQRVIHILSYNGEDYNDRGTGYKKRMLSRPECARWYYIPSPSKQITT